MTGDAQNGNFDKKYRLAGTALILIGAISLLELTLKTGWLILIIPPLFGAGLIYFGVKAQKSLLFIPGCLISSLGLGALLISDVHILFSLNQKIGTILLCLGLGCCAIFLLSIFISVNSAWWSLIPGFTILAAGFTFLTDHLSIIDFVFSLSLGIGLALATWGIARRLIGLIIPACLLLGTGLGIFFGWSELFTENVLARTGIMLFCFGCSWLLIITATWFVMKKFFWWPFIPGGIFIVVGIGLYAGGNPGSALHLIGNASSISFIIFGIYLLLLRKGIQK